MVRGRRARAANNNNEMASPKSAINFTDGIHGSQFDDQYFASPKRKDIKIDDTKPVKCKENPRTTKTRSQTIKSYFKNTTRSTDTGFEQCPTNVEICSFSDGHKSDDEILDDYEYSDHNGVDEPIQLNENIFLQKPVLSLNVDKSPNQASSIKINKSIPVEPIFSPPSSYSVNINGQFDKIVTLNTSPLNRESEAACNISRYYGFNIDNNSSCEYNGGPIIGAKVVEQSPTNRRRKPTTPHRILCPSPIKHPNVHQNVASSPVPVTLKTASSPGYLNVAQKRHPKSRRRLNTPLHENLSSIAAPQLIGGVTLNEALKNMSNANNNNLCTINQKSILNSAKNPSAEQNTNNNFKISQQKRTDGQMRPPLTHDGISKPKTGNHALTDFFPVRRSVRKTKTAVKEEMMRSLEKAIINEICDGLKVQHFEGKGRGIVADRLFKRGEFVVEYIGDLIDMNEANEREKQYALDENAGCYMYYFKHKNIQHCIDATAESGKLGRLVNHSRNGNLITKVVVVKNRPHLVLLAKDDIQQNDEITYDYGDRSKEALQHHPWLAL